MTPTAQTTAPESGPSTTAANTNTSGATETSAWGERLMLCR